MNKNRGLGLGLGLWCLSPLLAIFPGPSWLWSYGSWICNYLCNQCLSPLKFEFCSGEVYSTTLCDKVCQWLVAGWGFSPGTLVSSTTKTDCHNITEILLKVTLYTINQTINNLSVSIFLFLLSWAWVIWLLSVLQIVVAICYTILQNTMAIKSEWPNG